MWRVRHSRDIMAGLTAGLVIGLCAPAHGALFECLDPAGATVITDSPSQLVLCRIVVDQGPTDPRPTPLPPQAATPPPGRPLKLESSSDLVPPDSRTSPAVTVPLERIGSLFVVSLTINQSRETRLIVDTGASHTILSRRIARDLHLDADARITPVTMQTVGGTVHGEVVHIESIRVAQAEVRGTVAAIYDLPDAPMGVEGLLGLSYLRHFLVTLDTVHNQLVLMPVTP